MTDYCFTVDSPGTGFAGFSGTTRESGSYQCHIAPPWSAGTQIKMSLVYPLPYYFQVSANWQNLPAIPTTASYVASNAEIAPALGRNVGACARTPDLHQHDDDRADSAEQLFHGRTKQPD